MKKNTSTEMTANRGSKITSPASIAGIFRLMILGVSFAVSVMPAAMAETFSIDGMALNTNNNFPRKDGQPIMYTWQLNPNDNDQQFDRQGQLLRHRSTGNCLNAAAPSAGSIVNVWPCNSNDGDQKFDLVSPAGTNVLLIRRAGTNLCLDMDSRNANTRMKLWNCDINNANQRFRGNAGTNPPPPPPPQTQIYSGNNADSIASNTIMAKGSRLVSRNQCFRLDAQNDGNLVLYRNSDGKFLFNTGTPNLNVQKTIFQSDGNLVIYDGNNTPQWNSGTYNRGGTKLILQDDGNLVMYTSQNQPVWASNTVSPCNVTPQPQPQPSQRASQTKVNQFVAAWNGKTGITRYDLKGPYYDGQCVTPIARYLQDYYGASKTSLVLDNGRGTAAAVGRLFPNSYLPLSDPSDPIPGSIISFPTIGGGYGHVALVVSSQRSGNNLNLQIIDSNGDNTGANSVVRLRNLTVDTRNYTAAGYGSNIQWVNPKD